MIGELRAYQAEVFDAIARSVSLREGLTLSVEIARQGGKNELSAYVDPSDGHDDFLMSLALIVESTNQYEPRTAKGR
jgi:hypothetical protein